MLRKLREQRWYMFVWLPLSAALGIVAVWCWAIFQIIGGWTTRWDDAPKWGFFSAAVLGLLVLFLIFMFPRKPARGLKVTVASVGFTALTLFILFFLNTTIVTYQVSDVNGSQLKDIPIEITHHANGVAITGFWGKTVLHTDEQGKASIRIFKSEACDARVNDRLGEAPNYGNSLFSSESVFFFSFGSSVISKNWKFQRRSCVEHSYMIQFQAGPYISQRCLALPSTLDSGVINVYLRHVNSPELPPYYKKLFDQNANADPDFKIARQISIGGSIEGFDRVSDLCAAFSNEGLLQDTALYSAGLLAEQINEILEKLPTLAAADRSSLEITDLSESNKELCSLILYRWLGGGESSAPSHSDRIAYIQQRMALARERLIDALHPLMLKQKTAYVVLGALGQSARPAMRLYPEVFEKGTAEAKQAALSSIDAIAPSPEDVAFLIRSKNPDWIRYAVTFCWNRSQDERSTDLKSLEALRDRETDPEIIAAFNEVIREDSRMLATTPTSQVTPRYVVIDLGVKMLHPKKITNSGYVLGYNSSTYYVWFDGAETVLQPKYVGDTITVEDIDEAGTATGTETVVAASESSNRAINLAVWKKGTNPPKLTGASQPSLARKPLFQDQARAMNLPQIAGSPVIPQAANAAVALLPAEHGTLDQPSQLVSATQVIGNGSGGAYLWEMRHTRSDTKTFNGPRLINYLLPGEPTISQWNVTSVASINDGGSIVGTATYKPTSPTDPIAAGPHGVMLMPLAIVREGPPGSGDFEPIVDNGLDDNATIPIFRSAPPGTPNASTPETDGQGIFYIEMPGSIPASITLKCGNNRVTVQATPVKGRPNILRTGKLVLIAHGDPFKASDITTIDAGTPNDGGTLELQKYDRTIVK